MNDKCYDFLLTSRFNQNCLENVFSVLRRKNPKPTAWALKYHLRSLDLSQFMIKVKGSSYDKDDLNHLVGLTDFIDRKKKSKDNIIRQKQSKKIINLDTIDNKFDNTEKNVIHYVGGYVLKNYRQTHKMDYMLFACVLKVFFGN